MGHLSPEAFIDLLDGVVTQGDVQHLARCESCRVQLAELRSLSAGVAAVDVPEPSPLFWDHLSARVRDGIATSERESKRSVESGRSEVSVRSQGWRRLGDLWRSHWVWRAVPVASALAVVALAAWLWTPSIGITTGRVAVAPQTSQEQSGSATGTVGADDETLGFVADLASQLEWEVVADAGLVSSGGVDGVVTEMTDDERVELHRLLSEAMSGRES